MADPRELFPIVDDGTGAGTAPDKCVDTVTAAAAKTGIIGFAFKNSAGNVVLPQLTSDGKISVDTEGFGGTPLHAVGELAAGNLAMTAITNAELTLTLNKVYDKIAMVVMSLHASLFQLYYVDDAGEVGESETLLAEAIVGPGHFSFTNMLEGRNLDTTGGTGVQKLVLKGKNFVLASSLRGAISTIERATS